MSDKELLTTNTRPSREDYPLTEAGDLGFSRALIVWQGDAIDRLTAEVAELRRERDAWLQVWDNVKLDNPTLREDNKPLAVKVRLEQRSVMLDRLLFEVERKFSGETRFDTALRYIREAEARANETGQAQSAVPNA